MRLRCIISSASKARVNDYEASQRMDSSFHESRNRNSESETGFLILRIKNRRIRNYPNTPEDLISGLQGYGSEYIMQSSGSWDGGLTPDEFRVAAITLSDRWKQIDTGLPHWEWISHVSCIQNEGYLSMEGVYRCNSSEVLKPCIESFYSSVEEQGILEEEEPIDNATLILSDVGENRVYDFHIVYSFSYRVPVLYFRGYQSGGQPLNLDEIQKDLPCYSLTILRDSKWTFMTQEEHPYLHRPWYMLHPCGTCDWMKLLLGDKKPTDDSIITGYLPAWLSVVGQAVGLKIPLELQNMSLQDPSSFALDSRTFLHSNCQNI